MNQNETRTLWISVGAALFAVFLLYSYTQERTNELTKKFGSKQKVVVAAKDIGDMETLDESKLKIIEIPVEYAQNGHIKSMTDADGKTALAPIREGEQILENKIIEPGPVTGLALQIAPSKRAVTIPIDESRGVAKLIKPADRIDIVVAIDVGKGATQRREVKTLMQDVVVLATGLRVMNDLPRIFEKIGKDDYIKNIRADTNFNSITVETSPLEAQNLVYILATSPGSLFITLRHPSDRAKVNLTETSVDTVLNRADSMMLQDAMRAPAAVAPPPPPPAPILPVAPKPKPKSGPFKNL
jgi:pilus assembly protein CpaB